MNLENALHHALSAAAEADEIMMSYYKEDYLVHKKEGAQSRAAEVLTEADLKIDSFLHALLTDLFPQSSVVTEESTDKLKPDWHEKDWIWYIDPIDGSKSYLEQTDCFGVSIALCHKGIPVMGVITNPALKLKAWALQGKGAWLNNERITFPAITGDKPRLMLSTGQNKSPSYLMALSNLKPDELLLKSSVVTKALMVLKGEADYYFSLPREVFHGGAPSAWDLAGAAAIFREAGASSVDCYGNDLIFDTRSYSWIRGHIFGNPQATEMILPAMQRTIEARKKLAL